MIEVPTARPYAGTGTEPIPPVPDTAPVETVVAIVDAIPDGDVEAALRRVLTRPRWECSLCQDGRLPVWSQTGACVWCGAPPAVAS